MTITSGHAGKIEYIEETSYGDGAPSTGQLQKPSDAVLNVTIEPTTSAGKLHTIESSDTVDVVWGIFNYRVTVEYLVQQLKSTGTHTSTDVLAYYATHRSSGNLPSLALVIDTNDAFFELTGAYVNRYGWNCTPGEAIVATVEFLGNGLNPATSKADITSATDAPSIDEPIETYEGAVITRSGSWSEGIGSLSFEINNNVDFLPKLGSRDPAATACGYVDFTGTCDILCSDGGKDEITELLNGTETDIVCSSGTTSGKSLKFTFSNCCYTRTPVVYQTDMTGLKCNAEWTGESITFAAY